MLKYDYISIDFIKQGISVGYFRLQHLLASTTFPCQYISIIIISTMNIIAAIDSKYIDEAYAAFSSIIKSGSPVNSKSLSTIWFMMEMAMSHRQNFRLI